MTAPVERDHAVVFPERRPDAVQQVVAVAQAAVQEQERVTRPGSVVHPRRMSADLHMGRHVSPLPATHQNAPDGLAAGTPRAWLVEEGLRELTRCAAANPALVGAGPSAVWCARSRGRRGFRTSRRNHGAALSRGAGRRSWTASATGPGVLRLSTHTFRHVRLTDLARAQWTLDQMI